MSGSQLMLPAAEVSCNSEFRPSLEDLRYYFRTQNRFKGRYNIYSRMDIVSTIKKHVTDEEWQSLCDGCFGSVFQIGEGLKFMGVLVNMVMMHEVKTRKQLELWFKVAGNVVRFSIHEFAAVTSLNCSQDMPDVPKVEMLKVLGVKKCTVSDLEVMFLKEKNSRQRLMMAHLLVLEGILLPHRSEASIRTSSVALASDMEKFSKYPWGRKVYLATVDGLAKVSQHKYSGKGRPGFNLLGYPMAFQIWIIETFPHLQAVCNVGFRVDGLSGPIWYSKEPQAPLMHNKVEDALLTVAKVPVFRYDVVDLGGFGFPEEKPDPVIDPFVQWRMANVVIPPQAIQGALNNVGADQVEGAKAIRLRMRFAVYKLTASNTSHSGSSEETLDDKPVQKKHKPSNKGKSAAKKRPVEEPGEEVHTRKKRPVVH